MATVPGSGTTLSMKSMAQEALHGTYGSGTIVNPISLYDMTNGGQVNGSGDDYPGINTICTPNPATRGYLVLSNVEEVMVGGSINYYYSGGVGAASNLTIGHQLYTDTALTIPLYGDWYQDGSTGDPTYHCNTGLVWEFSTDSDGRITYSPTCS